ncbi:MAG: FHA domain-containing protein [Halioglobus sp.]
MEDLLELRNLETDQDIKVEKSKVIIGRDTSCDIVLDSGESSRRHAQLVNENGLWMLEDLKSTNGTYLNNREVRKSSLVKAGDIIRIGDQTLLVVNPNAPTNQTILGARMGTLPSSFVIDEGAADETSMRVAISTPPGWTSRDQAAFGSGADKTDDDLLTALLKTKDIDTSSAVAVLMVTKGRVKQSLFVVPRANSSDQWSVGRSSTCAIVIDDVTVSNNHATLELDDGDWHVRDQGSTNGVKVNGIRTELGRITSGDKVCFGEVELLFRRL